MFRIEIIKPEIVTKTGTSKRTGNAYAIPEQEAFVMLPNGERRRITLSHEPDSVALPVGMYVPGNAAGYVGKFGSLEVSTRARHWIPEKSAGKA